MNRTAAVLDRLRRRRPRYVRVSRPGWIPPPIICCPYWRNNAHKDGCPRIKADGGAKPWRM